jgi:tetratricopeptide (TPR) repeat protein
MDKEVESSTGRQVDEGIETPEEQEVESTIENEFEESLEQEIEDPIEQEEEKSCHNYKKAIKGAIITLCSLLILYGAMTAYFIDHYYFGSEINCINVSGKTVEAVEALMESELRNYTLTLKKRGGESEQIKAEDVGLRYTSYEELKKLKDSQNPFNWILACFSTKGSKIEVGVSYDEKLLKERIDNLSCFDNSKVIEPKNPSFQYIENSYVIVDEILGNKVDKSILNYHVANALLKKAVEVDLESIDCYVKPQYNSEAQKILEVKNILNKYVSSKITYTIANSHEVLDGSTINKWLVVDQNFRVSVDDRKVHDYIAALSEKYDTTGRTRSFMTSSGEAIQIGGGDFGRTINRAKEAESLIWDIKEGRTIIKEPAYSQRVFSHGGSDIADTYVEIDMTKQYIWFYKNSSLIVEGDIVTGNIKAGHKTPKGVYSLKYKTKNVVLRGPGYAAPVDFWMPFNGGIGIHDASWRSKFGGNIYKTDGSHGCINCPYNVAREIYNNIEPGVPVICY